MKANLLHLFIFLILPFFANSQLQDLYPTRSPGFYCSCSGDGQQPYPAPYRKLSHFIKNPSTNERIIIGNSCLYIEDSGKSKVAADGGTSYFEIIYYCNGGFDPFTNLDDPNFHINEFYDENGNLLGEDFEQYGKFTVEHREAMRLVLKYEHPKIPPTSKTLVINPWFGFISFEITIYHPPVVMIHGLWADRSSFDAMEANLLGTGLYEPWQLYKADYQSTNARSFSTNQSVPTRAIDQLLGQCWEEFMAVNKANVVSHSMGGLLTRKFVQGPFYTQHKSVNKIFTSNTPHQGSQMANWLLDNTSYGGSAAATVLNAVGYSTLGGAVNDLRVGSSEIVSIQNGAPQDPVKVHAINTVQSHTLPTPTYSWLVAMPLEYMLYQIAALCGSNYITDIFDSPDSDLVVALDSQAGGLTGLNTELYNDQVHVGSVGNTQVMSAVSSNLLVPNSDPAFANQFNSQILNYSIGSNCVFNSHIPREAKVGAVSLNITAPTAGQNVVAGTDLTITFNSTDIDSVVAFLPQTHQKFNIQKVKFSNNTFTLSTDIALLGPVKLVLAGYSATNELLTVNSVTYNQTTNATLNSIYTYPSSVYLHQNDSLAVNILGKYSDNVDRDITNDPNLTFSFLRNNATKLGKNIILNNTENDTLTVTYGGPAARVAANPVQINIYTLDPTATPLPVRLLSFTGKNTEKGNLLEWKTADETNFSHFEIERSPLTPDRGIAIQKFEKIGKKDSNESKNYEFLDANTPSGSGAGFYRLKLIDLDGKYSYSKIISIINTDQTPPSGGWGAVFPNPVTNQIKIANQNNASLTINLLDAFGKQIIKPILSDNREVIIPVNDLSNGVYFLQIKEAEKIKIHKLIKQ